MSIAFTTYVNEPLPSKITGNKRITRIPDPGPDNVNLEVATNNFSRNSSRTLECTISRWQNVHTECVNKLRMEILPMNCNFECGLSRVLEILDSEPYKLIALVEAHYQGLLTDIKGVYLGISR